MKVHLTGASVEELLDDRTPRHPRPVMGSPPDDFADALLRREVSRVFADRGDPLPPDVGAATIGGLDQVVSAARKAFHASMGMPSLMNAVANMARLEADEAEVFALLLAVESQPARQRLLRFIQDDATLDRITLRTLQLLFPAPHLGVLAVAHDSRLARACFVHVEGDRTWSTRTVSVAIPVTWAFAGDTSRDPDLPREATILPGETRPRRPGPVVVVSGGDRQTRTAKVCELLDVRPLLVTAPSEKAEAWEAVVREATLGGLGVLIESDNHLPPDARWWIERADHLAWGVSTPTDLPIDELPRRPWIEETIERTPVPSAEIQAIFGSDFEGGQRLDREQLRLAGLALAAKGGRSADAVRRLASGHLDRLSTRIAPRRTWDDIVLPPEQLASVQSLVSRYHHRGTVYEDWGFKPLPSAGVAALFCGASGTGKTLAAEVVAGSLGLDLYKLELSAVVSKYIGETEQNLERVFRGAEAADVVLLFDEADALLGKRSDVGDAHDRYANIEVSYLLQRLERFDGLVIMSTNLANNIDRAFTRRLHVVVEFPKPDEKHRLEIWKRSFPPECPSESLDLDWAACNFELTGGNIRNCALTAAFAAAAAGRPIGMDDVRLGIRRELMKMGRLVHDGDM